MIEPVIEPADAVAAAVLAVPGVAALHGGSYGEVATYLPGRTVTGVQVRPGRTAVHIVLHPGVPVLAAADAVRAAAAAVVGHQVDVTVEDIATEQVGSGDINSEEIPA